jgi:hypothetical protein
VQYVKGQYYVKHHDTSMQYDKMPCGHRIYTLFVYFSDVEEGRGGETSFPNLGIKVRPKKGAAVLWANVKDQDPHKVDYRYAASASGEALRLAACIAYIVCLYTSLHQFCAFDFRTEHEALPVDDGVFKLAANMWLYQYDFRTPWKISCTNF